MSSSVRPPREHSLTASLLAGSVGGAAQVIVGQPLDTIKTRAQTAPAGAFKGPMDIARQTIKKEGILALYKGMASPLLGVAGVNSLLFMSNTYARKLVNPFGNLSIKDVALAGAIAGAAQSILASPVEMFKIRMQGQYGSGGKRLRDVVGEMYGKYGWRKGILRGYWITVVREIPAYAGFFAGFEGTKRAFQQHYGSSSIPVWAILTSGGAGGIAYWTACYPLDVVKSRIQLQEAPPKGFNYIIDTFRTIYREEGAKAFVRGLSPTYARAVPAAASTFVAFELTMDFIQKHTDI
ncbi:mitochondrial carrier [Meredithblackwellia eburnea MCA 4105]